MIVGNVEAESIPDRDQKLTKQFSVAQVSVTSRSLAGVDFDGGKPLCRSTGPTT